MKMNPLIWVALIVIILGGGAYFLMMRPAQDSMYQAPTTQMSEVVSVTLGEQNDLGQTGVATLKENADGKVVVTLTLSGGDFSAPQPAHIHVGSCPTPGAVEYPLTSVENGMSETTLAVSLADLKAKDGAMAINVHKSAEEASVYTACGNLMF